MVTVIIEESIPWNFTHWTGGVSNVDGFLSGRVITPINQNIVENAGILVVHQRSKDSLGRNLICRDSDIRIPTSLRVVPDALKCVRKVP